MSTTSKQVFQTNDPARWKRVKWTGRVFLFVILFFLLILGFALYRAYNPSLPELENKAEAYKKILNPGKGVIFANAKNKDYNGFRDVLFNKINRQLNNRNDSTRPLRMAFYTNWGAQSMSSLDRALGKIDVLIPEWIFINDTTYLPETDIDTLVIKKARQAQAKIMPMISNFNTDPAVKDFDGKLIHEILNNASLRSNFINHIIRLAERYHFDGFNLDFEELKEKSSEPLVNFCRELSHELHRKKLKLSIDISPGNNDYDLEELIRYNDYLVLMAYDQHSESTVPGPVSAQKWIEEALDIVANKIPSNKIVLGIGAFGYDWPQDAKGTSVTYQQALAYAKNYNATVDFDNNSYNLHYSYSEKYIDDKGAQQSIRHEVWFNDAATVFNMLRFGDEYGVAGTAMWKLGSEDERVWQFYGRNLDNEAVKKNPFNFRSLEYVPYSGGRFNFIGSGEVLDIQSAAEEGRLRIETDSAEQLVAEQFYEQIPSGYVIKRFGEDTSETNRKIILTFDDGPDPNWTPKILDILERENVPASFFVVGLQAEKNIPIVRRIYKDGFEIGNHTFTHRNIATMTPERAALEMKLTRLLIECITGRSTIMFRAPYNADSEPHTEDELRPIARSREENYYTIGESIDPNDWQEGVSADTIFKRTVQLEASTRGNIILLHDAGGSSREETVKALPKIIEYFKKRGYKFTTVADLIGVSKDRVMPALPKGKDESLVRMNLYLVEFVYWGGQVIYALFITGIFLSVGRMIAVAIFAALQKKREKQESLTAATPKVSIIVPAYNEEVSAVSTIESLLQQDYPDFDIVFVDDGSADKTFDKVSEAFRGNPRVKVFTKTNGGKASALNFGIGHSEAEFVVCIDADTQLQRNAVSELMKRFIHQEVGAVAGNVKVGNEINMLTNWQSIEYITAQNFDRRAFDLLDCITVVPGAIGAFRKDAILIAGGFTTDTLAEDCDLTMRLHRNQYIVKNCSSAVAMTEAPETLKGFLKQRFRWSFGIMQSFWKHRDAVFNPAYKNFGMIALPNILIYQILLPFLAPLADLILIISLVAAGMGIIDAGLLHVLFYYLVFTLVDMAGAALAFAFEKADYRKLLWMLPQRFVYRQLMYYVLIKSIRQAAKGEMQGWGKLKRTGNVKLGTT